MDAAHTIQQILHQPPGEKRVLSLLPAIVVGFAIFLVMSAVPVGLGFLSYGLGMGAIVALALAGLSLGYRGGILSVLGATFAALLPAAMAVGGADDFKTAMRTTAAEIPVADAPRHGEAQVLVFSDARVATEFTHAWTSVSSARGPEVHRAMAPLVPQGWQRGMPVPAWRVCSGGDADWCPKALAYPVRAAQRLGDADVTRYKPEVAQAERRYGLASAAGAPLLYLTQPPAERAAAAVTGMILMPILGFVVWLLGLLLWRGVRRLRSAVMG
jgi:hypothetical protein